MKASSLIKEFDTLDKNFLLQSEIRDLSALSISEVVRLEPKIFPRGWSKALIESEFENPNSIRLGIFSKGILVGYSFSRIVDDEFNILNIGIDLNFRGMGLGQKLLDCVLNEARNRNCSIAFLEVRESNVLAQSIYQKAGFKISGRRASYYSDNGEAALLMELAFFL